MSERCFECPGPCRFIERMQRNESILPERPTLVDRGMGILAGEQITIVNLPWRYHELPWNGARTSHVAIKTSGFGRIGSSLSLTDS